MLSEFIKNQLSNSYRKELNLTRGNLDREAVIELAALLATNKSLTSLYLCENDIDNAGAEKIAAALEINIVD